MDRGLYQSASEVVRAGLRRLKEERETRRMRLPAALEELEAQLSQLAERDARALSSVIARLGVADVRAFGLAWEDCEDLLRELGFAPRVEVVASQTPAGVACL